MAISLIKILPRPFISDPKSLSWPQSPEWFSFFWSFWPHLHYSAPWPCSLSVLASPAFKEHTIDLPTSGPKLPLLGRLFSRELHASPHFSLRSVLKCHLIREVFTGCPNEKSSVPAPISISILLTLTPCFITLITFYHIKHVLVYCPSPVRKSLRTENSAISLMREMHHQHLEQLLAPRKTPQVCVA